MREVVLDTETTGLDPLSGDRIIEIGCVELHNHIPTGRIYQTYIDPERPIPWSATEVTGITDDMVRGKPRFAEVEEHLSTFLGNDQLIIHNASFDLAFLNAELALVSKPPIPSTRAHDTLSIARRKYPGGPASLDALCRRFGIDTSEREKHGALVDAKLLADVYLELIGGRQGALLLAEASSALTAAALGQVQYGARPLPLPALVSEEEAAAHAAFILQELGAKSLWARVMAQLYPPAAMLPAAS